MGLALSLFAAAPAHALPLDAVALKPAVLSGFVSHHMGTERPYNEHNYGLGYRHSSGLVGGYYRNSNDNDSLYIGHESRWSLSSHLDVGAVAGVVTGYRYSVIPFLLPELVAKAGSLEVALTYAPRVSDVIPALFAVQARWNLD